MSYKMEATFAATFNSCCYQPAGPTNCQHPVENKESITANRGPAAASKQFCRVRQLYVLLLLLFSPRLSNQGVRGHTKVLEP